MRNKRGYSREVMSWLYIPFVSDSALPRATLYVTETSKTEVETDTRDTTPWDDWDYRDWIWYECEMTLWQLVIIKDCLNIGYCSLFDSEMPEKLLR